MMMPHRLCFPTVVEGDVDGSGVVGDVPFVPKVYHDGLFHPICAHGFVENYDGAAAVCRSLGKMHGGHVRPTRAVFEVDAMPVGACGAGESLAECSKGKNAYGDLAGENGRCATGNAVGVEVSCNHQVGAGCVCRLLTVFPQLKVSCCIG
jgi:hypothetical protein